MTDAQLALLVLVLLYLWECLLWLRRDAACFLPTLRGRHRIAIGGGLYGTHRKGVVLTNPIPLIGQAFVSQLWPLSISPGAVYSYVSQAFNPGPRPEQTERLVTFEEMTAIEIDDCSVYVNGSPLVVMQSPVLARHAAATIKALASLDADKRAKAIDRAIENMLDPAAVERRLAAYRAATRWIRLWSDLLFLHLLVVCPLTAWRVGLAGTWPMLLPALIFLMVATVASFWRAHRRLYPQERTGLWTHALSVGLFPPATIRAASALARDALIEFHPLAVARVLCAPERFREFAAAFVRDLNSPIEPLCPDERAQARAAEQYYRDRLTAGVRRFFDSAGLNVEELCRPPVREDDATQSYCPRCHTQFLIAEGTCASCGGLRLEPLGRAAECPRAEKQPPGGPLPL